MTTIDEKTVRVDRSGRVPAVIVDHPSADSEDTDGSYRNRVDRSFVRWEQASRHVVRATLILLFLILLFA